MEDETKIRQLEEKLENLQLEQETKDLQLKKGSEKELQINIDLQNKIYSELLLIYKKLKK